MTTKAAPSLVDRKFLHLQDQKPSGTAGGSGTTGAFFTRDLTQKVHDSIGSTLASNTFTLPAGTYIINATVPAFNTQSSQGRLYNVTDSSVILLGTSAYTQNSSDTCTIPSFIVGVFTITAAKTFRVEHRISTAGTGRLGIATGWGTEVYTEVLIEKVA